MKELLVYTFNKNDLKNKEVFAGIFAGLHDDNVHYDVINYKGLKVHAWFEILLLGKCDIRINWIQARKDFPQGVDVGIHHARLKILDGSNAETKSGFAFMYDRWFPDQVPLLCAPIKYRDKEKQKKEKWVGLHSVWERKVIGGYPEHEYVQRESWYGNYGVVIEQREKDVYRLHFSCGNVDHPNVTFDDLVIDVSIEGEYETRFQCSGDPKKVLNSR